MNLSVISEQIAIDKVETRNSKNFVHFLSRPDEALRLPKNWDSNVYMSKTTARGMMLKQTPIPMKFIRILEINKPVSITLPDGTSCTVTMFENSGLAESVAFHFKGDKGTALYSGSFTRCRALLLNNLLRRYVLNGIDFLYVDNTAANSTDPVSQSTAAFEILKIANRYPDHQILMNVPPFGYEDLIYSVVNLAKLRVFAEGLHLVVFEKYNVSKLFESDIREARVIVAKQEVVTTETIYRRFKKEKLLTLRVIPCASAPKNYFEKSGLFQVHWSPHPLLFEICHLVNYIKPKSVRGIYPSSNLPALLRGSHQEEMESNRQIENLIIKAESTKTSQIESVPEDSQLDKSWSIFDSASEPEGLSGCSEVKQSLKITSQPELKEKQGFPSQQDIKIPSSRKRRRKSGKDYPKLPRRFQNQKEADLLEESKISFNAAEKDLLINDKGMQIEKSLSISTFTSLSVLTNNDHVLNANKEDTSKQSDKIPTSVKSASVSTFTSLSSFSDNQIKEDEVLNIVKPAIKNVAQNNETKSGGKSAGSQNQNQSQTRFRQENQTKPKPAKRLKTTSKKSRRDSGSKPHKESGQENLTSLSVVCSLTISTFSSLELESSLASSIIPIKRKKISRPVRDSDSENGEKSAPINYKTQINHELRITSKTSVTSKVTTKNLDLDRLPRRKQSGTIHKSSTTLRTQSKCKGQSKKGSQEELIPNNKISGKKTGSKNSKNQENIYHSLKTPKRLNNKKESVPKSIPKAQESQNDRLVELVFSNHKKIVEKKAY